MSASTPLLAGRFTAWAQLALVRAGLVPPSAGEVAVVWFDTSAWEAEVRAVSALLEPAEQQRAARFRFDRDRRTYVWAHVLWRVLLGHCLDVAPAAVPLRFAVSGQPQLPGTSLATSLSHSGPLVLLAVGGVATLGIDIERTPPRRPLADLIATICTPQEAAALRPLPAADREQALLRLWTRKEALLKAFGVGLAQAPSLFSAVPGVPVAAPAGSGWPACCTCDLVLPVGCVGALAAPPGTVFRPLRLIDGPPLGATAQTPQRPA